MHGFAVNDKKITVMSHHCTCKNKTQENQQTKWKSPDKNGEVMTQHTGYSGPAIYNDGVMRLAWHTYTMFHHLSRWVESSRVAAELLHLLLVIWIWIVWTAVKNLAIYNCAPSQNQVLFVPFVWWGGGEKNCSWDWCQQVNMLWPVPAKGLACLLDKFKRYMTHIWVKGLHNIYRIFPTIAHRAELGPLTSYKNSIWTQPFKSRTSE